MYVTYIILHIILHFTYYVCYIYYILYVCYIYLQILLRIIKLLQVSKFQDSPTIYVWQGSEYYGGSFVP